MVKPSEKSLDLAEELLDYVHPGMTRSAALQEVAGMVDEMNTELVEAVTALLNEIEESGAGTHAVLVSHLRHVLADYKAWSTESEEQHDLFTSPTESATHNNSTAGQMP